MAPTGIRRETGLVRPRADRHNDTGAYMQNLKGSVVAALCLALAGLGCSAQTTTTPTTPTTTTNTTESFTGSLSMNGAVSFAFSVSATGYVTANLKKLSPDVSTPVGLALGTWNGLTCQVVITNDTAVQASTVTGYANSATSLCVRLFDVGQLTRTNTFEITVVHP